MQKFLVALMPATEIAPEVINSRAFFFELARPVETNTSTRSWPCAVVGRKFAKRFS